jgi:hypothetical protein
MGNGGTIGSGGVVGSGGAIGSGGVADGGAEVASEVGPACDPDAGAGAWRLFGPPISLSANVVTVPSLALLPDGNPVVAWRDVSVVHTRVWRPEGCDGSWQPLGSPIASFTATLLVPPGTDKPVRAWISNDRPPVVTVDRWNGTAFEVLGAPLIPQSSTAASPVLADGGNGTLIAGWVDGVNVGSSSVQIARWDGTTWTMLNTAAGVLGAQAYGSSYRALSIAVTPAGVPVVAFAGLSYVTTVAKFVSGTTWTMLGTAPAADSGVDNGPIVKINSVGDIFLASAARVQPSVYHVSVARFDGNVWQPLGASIAATGTVRSYDMALDTIGSPIIVEGEEIYATVDSPGSLPLFTYHWDGAGWPALAPAELASAPPASESDPTIAIDGKGQLVAAWQHAANLSLSMAIARFQR